MQALEFLPQILDLSFRFQQCFSKRTAAPTLADEIDKVRKPTLFGCKFGFFEANRFGNVGVELTDLDLDAP